MFVARFVTVTVAPGMPARCGSNTVPRMRPDCSCAKTVVTAEHKQRGQKSNSREHLRHATSSILWLKSGAYHMRATVSRYETTKNFTILDLQLSAHTSESAAASTSVISTIPSFTPATRKRYRPRGVSPESRAPSFAASNTLKWHPHSNSGCEDCCRSCGPIVPGPSRDRPGTVRADTSRTARSGRFGFGTARR